jgi:flagellar motor switch protein FliN/FliY
MEDAKQDPSLDDESWMNEMGWGEDATAEATPAAAAIPGIVTAASATAMTPSFAPLPSSTLDADRSHIDLLLDINLQVTVELGRARMKIAEILALRNGSVIELDRLAGEPADILVNGTLIAKGEVVVVDEKFGVRVIEVVSRAKRIASLG